MNGNTTLNPNTVANPCGLIAKSLFNDTYWLYQNDGPLVTIDASNIAWKSDVDNKFKPL